MCWLHAYVSICSLIKDIKIYTSLYFLTQISALWYVPLQSFRKKHGKRNSLMVVLLEWSEGLPLPEVIASLSKVH